jgi:predicted GIY-YIG superfamily endonuclease
VGYQVRQAINGKPQPINRLDRADNSGLLYIGVSTNLQSRIKNFWKRLKGGKAPHTAGHTFTAYNFERKIRPDHLEVRWVQLQKRELDNTETIFLEKYVKKIPRQTPTQPCCQKKKDKTISYHSPLRTQHSKILGHI